MADDNEKKNDPKDAGDENLNKAKMASEFLNVQNKLSDYQKKYEALSNKVFTGRYKGVTLQMRGDYLIVDVKIDQSVYETASKSAIEQSFLICATNLHNAIGQELTSLKNELQQNIGLSGMQIPGF